MKRFNPACERNKAPIIGELVPRLAKSSIVLEIGSGSGQHAAWFAERLPHVRWQPTEQPSAINDLCDSLPEYLSAGTNNLLTPRVLDVSSSAWPTGADAIFTANTLHWITWAQVEKLFAGAGELLDEDGLLLAYGPFRFGGQPMGPGNVEFDRSLRSQGRGRGIRDFEALERLAEANGFGPAEVVHLPANNQLLCWHCRRA
ncbi:MAG: DUF938 domain-containing protein [Gammaproteobacteria bacterium]